MKKILISLVAITVITGFYSCTNKLSVEKAETIIKEHPFLKEISVAITNKYFPNCTDDLLGERENGYVGWRGDLFTAYYYKKHGFKLVKIEDMTVNKEYNTVTCRIILAPDGITNALNELQKLHSLFKPDISVNGELFTVTMQKEKKWTIIDFRHSSNDVFKINGWRNGEFIYDITPNSSIINE